jgi:hypothetical protein
MVSQRPSRPHSSRTPTVEKGTLAGTLAVLSFGLTALFAVLDFEALVPVTFVLGFFILLPLVGVLGEDLPYVVADDEESTDSDASADDPVAELRQRYARGDIDEGEFERRLDALLETEDLEGVVNGDATDMVDRGRATDRDPATELE